VAAAVTQCGLALQHASNNQKGSFGIVLTALRQNRSAFRYISKEFIVAAVTRYH